MGGEAFRIAVPLHSRSNKRSSDRFVAEMPLTVDGRPGTTQDLSPGGLAFVSERPYELGAKVQVVIEYLLDGHNFPLECEAEVVRVQQGPDGYTIGARLTLQSQQLDLPLPGTD